MITLKRIFALTDNFQEEVQRLCAETANGSLERLQITFALQQITVGSQVHGRCYMVSTRVEATNSRFNEKIEHSYLLI